MKLIFLAIITIFTSAFAVGQYIPLNKLLSVRTENLDSIQAFLFQNRYKLYSVKKPEDGKIASANIKYIFAENSKSEYKKECFITVWTSPNLDEMYNFSNSIEIEFKNTNNYNLYRSEILSYDFKLLKTTYENNTILNYYYKQTGNLKIQGQFIIFKLFSSKFLPQQKASSFLLEITSLIKCPECADFVIEN